jgi:hypothetical protein
MEASHHTDTRAALSQTRNAMEHRSSPPWPASGPPTPYSAGLA